MKNQTYSFYKKKFIYFGAKLLKETTKFDTMFIRNLYCVID